MKRYYFQRLFTVTSFIFITTTCVASQTFPDDFFLDGGPSTPSLTAISSASDVQPVNTRDDIRRLGEGLAAPAEDTEALLEANRALQAEVCSRDEQIEALHRMLFTANLEKKGLHQNVFWLSQQLMAKTKELESLQHEVTPAYKRALAALTKLQCDYFEQTRKLDEMYRNYATLYNKLLEMRQQIFSSEAD